MSHEPWHKETRGERVRGALAGAGAATKSGIDAAFDWLNPFSGGGGGGPYGIGYVDDALLAVEDALAGQSQIEPRLIARGAGAAGRALQGLPGGMVAAGERLQGGQRVEDRLLGSVLGAAGGLFGGNAAPAAAALRPLDPGLGMTAAERENEAFQHAIRDAATAAASPSRVSHANFPGLNEPSTPGGFSRADNLRMLDSILAPGNSGTITTKNNDGSSTTIKIDPGQQGDGFAGLNVPTSLADLNRPTPDTSPAPTSSGPGAGATQQDDIAAYLAMLEGLGSDDARINFASEAGFLTDAAAAELRLGGGGLGEDNVKYKWENGKIDLIAGDTATDEDPPGPTPAEQCAADGGTWNGESCVMPDGETVTAEEQCVNDGGTWNGESCVMPGGEGEEVTLTENQVNTVTNKVQERANIINSMVQAGLIDIGTARTMYDESVATIFSNFIGEQGKVLGAFKDDLAAAGVQRESDRNAMLGTLRKAGIDPGLISAQLAEIDAIYGEGSQAQRDYLDNITRIGSMANIEHGLMGDYIFGGYEQQLRGEGRRMAADAALAGVDKTEALELAGQQAAQLAGIYGGSPDSILAGLLSGVDVAGTLEQRRAVEDAQQFATDERIAGQDFTRGQNLFNTLAGRMTTPYQQAQLDLAGKQYDLNLFETLDEMMQPTDAAVQQQIRQQTAADYKSALQTWNSAQAIAGRTGSPMPNPVDVLSESQIDALYQYDVDVSDLRRKEDNLGAFADAMEVDLSVLRGAIESGVQGQVIAELIDAANDPRVPYLPPGASGPGLLMPLSEAVKRYEWDYKQPEEVADPMELYGFAAGDYATGYDVDAVSKIVELMMQGGMDPGPMLEILFAPQAP